MAMLAILYVALPALQIALFLYGRPLTGFAEALNYAASISAFHWLSANVILSAKIPRLQRALPYDARIRFHIFSTAGIASALAYHAVYKIALGKTIDILSWSLLVAIGAMLVSAVLWIPVPGFASFREKALSFLRKGKAFSYDRTKSLHGWFVLGLSLLIILHVANAGLFDDVPPASTLLYFILYALSFGLYGVSKTGIYGVGATVARVEPHREILTISLVPDRRHRFLSGQFAFLRARGVARREEHPFSYLSVPGEGELRFAVRSCGDFTNKLAGLKVGDRVRVTGGFGAFRPGKEGALCFIASGIGTVPFISILKELSASGDRRPLKFFLAVNYEDEVPDLAEVRRIAAEMPNLDLRLLVFSVDGLRYSTDFFRAELPESGRYAYYICSSPRVRTEVVRSLTDLGVARSKIKFEAFSLG